MNRIPNLIGTIVLPCALSLVVYNFCFTKISTFLSESTDRLDYYSELDAFHMHLLIKFSRAYTIANFKKYGTKFATIKRSKDFFLCASNMR